MGGQTALNLAVDLADAGILDKYDVEMIGAKLEAIKKAEDRLLFKDAMTRIGLDVPRSALVNNIRDGLEFAAKIGFPVIIRPSFTLGGSGGGLAYNREELMEILARGLDLSPVHECLIEESVLGWKEYELEVMRDLADNVIIICSIENYRPDGRAHRRLDYRGAGADADRSRVPVDARCGDRGDARDRRRDRRIECAVRREPGDRADDGDRDESAGIAIVGAGFEGDRLSDRQDCGQAGGRLYAR